MKYIGMLVVGIIGFIIGEGISRAIRKDSTTQGDNLTITWTFKIIVALILMGIVYENC